MSEEFELDTESALSYLDACAKLLTSDRVNNARSMQCCFLIVSVLYERFRIAGDYKNLDGLVNYEGFKNKLIEEPRLLDGYVKLKDLLLFVLLPVLAICVAFTAITLTFVGLMLSWKGCP